MSSALLMLVCVLVGTACSFPTSNDTITLDERATCGKGSTSYSERFKSAWLSRHNSLRKAEGLNDLEWNDELARRAEQLAQSCEYGHALLTKCDEKTHIGQNLYASAATSSAADPDLGAPAVQAWYDEVKDYNRDTNVCSAVTPESCGHYTQVMWRETSQVGCAAAKCGKWDFWPQYPHTFYVVCNYYKGGNVNGGRPF